MGVLCSNITHLNFKWMYNSHSLFVFLSVFFFQVERDSAWCLEKCFSWKDMDIEANR